MNKKMIYVWLGFLWLVAGCTIYDEPAEYEEKLVVFANLTANQPMIDTVFVSRSAAIEERIPFEELYIPDAEVLFIIGGDTIPAPAVPDRPGRYLTGPSVVFPAGETVRMRVVHDNDTVRAETTLPTRMDYSSMAGEAYNCNGSSLPIPMINTDNVSLVNGIPNITGTVDTVVYRSGECYTQSFASYPYFQLQFNAEDYNTIRLLSFALEADVRGLEPYEDTDDDGIWDAGVEPYADMNRNGERDSSFINLIYDTTFTSQIWKGSFYRDENNDPYRINPFVWTLENSPIPVNWLFFNYYGLHLIVLQATDEAYYNYYKGQPFGVGTNLYQLPDSNIEGGYGLFSSTYSAYFLVYVARE